MTREEALTLVGVLVAGFPHDAIERETVALYVAEFEGLCDLDAATNVTRGIIRSDHRFPTLAHFLDCYQVEHRRLDAERERPRELEAVTSGPREFPAEVKDWMTRRGWKPGVRMRGIDGWEG